MTNALPAAMTTAALISALERAGIDPSQVPARDVAGGVLHRVTLLELLRRRTLVADLELPLLVEDSGEGFRVILTCLLVGLQRQHFTSDPVATARALACDVGPTSFYEFLSPLTDRSERAAALVQALVEEADARVRPALASLVSSGAGRAALLAELRADLAITLAGPRPSDLMVASLAALVQGLPDHDRNLVVVGATAFDEDDDQVYRAAPEDVGHHAWFELIAALAPSPAPDALVVSTLELEVLLRTGVVTHHAPLVDGDTDAVLETALTLASRGDVTLADALVQSRALEG